jgi:hypothetical protein
MFMYAYLYMPFIYRYCFYFSLRNYTTACTTYYEYKFLEKKTTMILKLLILIFIFIFVEFQFVLIKVILCNKKNTCI